MKDDKGGFVSRAGLKLAHALEKFNLDVKNRVVLDLGSSTGGFADCLLKQGVAKIYCVDTSYGELSWKIRNDERVTVMERTNALHLQSLGEKVDLITVDVGWTRLGVVLPAVKKFLKAEGRIVALLKPHYEADQKLLSGGVLSEEEAGKTRIRVIDDLENLGFKMLTWCKSPILGKEGNVEYLLLIGV